MFFEPGELSGCFDADVELTYVRGTVGCLRRRRLQRCGREPVVCALISPGEGGGCGGCTFLLTYLFTYTITLLAFSSFFPIMRVDEGVVVMRKRWFW